MRARTQPRPSITAIRVKQWLRDWDDVHYDAGWRRAEPRHEFFVFSMGAARLKALSGIQRRSAETGGPREQDIGIQRQHDEKRSAEIGRFVHAGFPWSTLSEPQRQRDEFNQLKKPGWLPTAIVVNILRPEDDRKGRSVDAADAIQVEEVDDASVRLLLPSDLDVGWRPHALRPIEVIDGQHRLWAFDDSDDQGYELPVVAFFGLDISWQAYLFWTINIKPKKINASLAFDLYPLLRTEDWLEHVSGPPVYRETRAQELTELMWALPESPWYQRINMLGERGRRTVTQAAWIRALLSSYLRPSVSNGVGGLFAAPAPPEDEVLQWSRAQQSALLVHAWTTLRERIRAATDDWMLHIRRDVEERARRGQQLLPEQDDPAFSGRHSLLNGDQGVRAFLSITNDLIYVAAPDLRLSAWLSEEVGSEMNHDRVREALAEVHDQQVGDFIQRLSDVLAHFDWRTSAASGLTEEEQNLKASYRGTGGYARLRRQILRHVAARGDQQLRTIANTVRLATEQTEAP